MVVPQVETVEQAQHVVSAAKFGTAARGTRSMPPFRLIPGVTDMAHDPSRSLPENLNDQAAIILQIETLQGIHNLDAILREVPDIDAVWLGTLDARVSMGLPANGGMGGPEKAWTDAVALFEATLDKHRVKRAGFAFGEDADAARRMGGRNCVNVVAADVLALMGMMGDLGRMRGLFPAEAKVGAAAKASEEKAANGEVKVAAKAPDEKVANGEMKEKDQEKEPYLRVNGS